MTCLEIILGVTILILVLSIAFFVALFRDVFKEINATQLQISDLCEIMVKAGIAKRKEPHETR